MREAVKTVFLDRDGVINQRINNGYVTGLKDFQILDGALEGLALLSQSGFRLVVITNQRGISQGLYTHEDLAAIHEHLSELLFVKGGILKEYYYCPHDREEGCLCRKPKPGLLDMAHRVKNVAWEESYLIGDSDSDLLAGRKRNVKVIKIGMHHTVAADAYFPSLLKAARSIVRGEI